MERLPPLIEIGRVLVSMDCLTEYFCCDLSVCKGACCIEGDAGAPVTLDEIAHLEEALDVVWGDLSAQAQAVIDRQGVAYTDSEGDLVTCIVNGRDCVFTCYADLQDPTAGVISGCCLCALERAYRAGKSQFCKPISCALYPIREKKIGNNRIGLNYDRWNVCRCAREKGQQLRLPVYQFLRKPLISRFGESWYAELETVAAELQRQGLLG